MNPNKDLLDFLAEMPDEAWEGISGPTPREFPLPGPVPPVHLRETIMGTAPPPTTTSNPVDLRAYAEALRAEEERARLDRIRRRGRYPWDQPQ